MSHLKVGGQKFLLKRKSGPTIFWEKNAKIPQPSPPPRKNVPSLRETCFFLYDNKIADFEVWIPSEQFGPEMVPSSCIVKKLSAITT